MKGISMKGISLPLETVILLILAAVVLAALLGFFLGAFTPAQTEAELLKDQNRVCQEIALKGCTTQAAIKIAKDKLLNKICKKDRPACSGANAEECIKSCCKLFCG